jgi:predicted CXXCH cytochrome family protein
MKSKGCWRVSRTTISRRFRVLREGRNVLLLFLMAVILAGSVTGCGKSPPATRQTVAQAVAQTSGSCRECHAEIFTAWETTDHALANRPVRLPADAAALAGFHPPAGIGPDVAPEFILGHKPLWQPLIPEPGGRWQAHELAYDPKKKDWFNVFGAENRRPGEWGHWSGRGMNWNSMCAQCHMTGYQKGYDVATDTYHSSWVEQGVGCIQCHSPMPANHKYLPKNFTAPGADPKKTAPFFGDRAKMMQTCAPCHARNEQLTLDFQPGDSYYDHYRPVLPVDPGVYYPDGQQREEDYNWTSVLLSRMGGHGGVTCLDCHDPHSTKTRLPAATNQLCLQCHAAPGRVLPSGVRAVAIDPVAHSHHAEGSTGNSCIACHMPTTTYMQLSPRHDHGWLKPDPLMTQELGIPNACSRCHADKPITWAMAKTDEWYGAKLDSRQRARARAVSAAQNSRPEAGPRLLALLAEEDIPAWRATYLSLLVPYLGTAEEIVAAGRAGLKATDPIERAAAVRLLNGYEPAKEWVRPLLKDPVRLVRLDAEWLLSRELAADSPERKEFNVYLAVSLDQPAGQLRFGQDLANRGKLAEAEPYLARAAAWDPFSPGIQDAWGMVLAAEGRNVEAGGEVCPGGRIAADRRGGPTAGRAGLGGCRATAGGGGGVPDGGGAQPEIRPGLV